MNQRQILAIRRSIEMNWASRRRAIANPRPTWFAAWLLIEFLSVVVVHDARTEDRYQSDSDARYLHHIILYDVDNQKITPASTRPYSPLNTCGRCHDYEQISHGWHFNAFQTDSIDGRQGEPWVWTDDRTGTQLPLTYRDWSAGFSPAEIGISPWEMTLQFGARVPGGNMGAKPSAEAPVASESPAVSAPNQDTASAQDAASATTVSRWPLSGWLEIDCMICHAVSGGYDTGERRRHINDQNFAWAPTAALRLGTIDGRVSEIKADANPDDEATRSKLPTVAYNSARFHSDGTVFVDLIRKPTSNACYQCHSQRPVAADGIEPRWIHDEDIHLRSGMVCADCHRNGIDHHIVRGFPGELHPSAAIATTLSCEGCHLGSEAETNSPDNATTRAGRMGAPRPAHAGLPPLHFEKLSCTACHGGPIPKDEVSRMMTSLAHGLGERGHRNGRELPAILAPVFMKDDQQRVAPHRAMWPAFWGQLDDGKIVPLPPQQVYEATRRSLRVRSNFVDEIFAPKLPAAQLKELLGDERGSKSDDWTDEERAKVEKAQADLGRSNFDEKVSLALQAIQTELKIESPVYVSNGFVYQRDAEGKLLRNADVNDSRATSMIAWPLAHQVRPAAWALGAEGCVECHSDSGKVFVSTVRSDGPGPDRSEAISMAQLQGVDADQRLTWNQMFQSRSIFKYLMASSLALLLMILFVGLGAWIATLTNRGSTT